MNPLHIIFFNLIALLCTSVAAFCDQPQRYQQSEYIFRRHNDTFCTIPQATPQIPDPYPWEKTISGNCQKITKDFFRCRGSNLNPPHSAQEKGEAIRQYDCGGSEKHSLPLRDQKEFVYPILVDLLNYIQIKTHKQVVITSGHRCPDHNTYVDPSKENSFSKHTIGAEVSFYVKGLEDHPESIVKLLQDYYRETKKYQAKKEYLEFKRFEKKTDVSTQPWLNKEIFIKLFKKKEGRNFDNRHPYPYVSIQVRHDFDSNEKVTYSWEKANNNFLRY